MFTTGLALMVLHAAMAMTVQQDAGLKQEMFDQGARETAARATPASIAEGAEPLMSHGEALDPAAHPWRPTSDDDMRGRSSYWSPQGYRFHRSARADLDRDGRSDLVEFVENGQQRGLRIIYGLEGKPSRVIAQDDGGWSDQGVFPAGPNAVMINYPESTAFFLFERRGKMMARYLGD